MRGRNVTWPLSPRVTYLSGVAKDSTIRARARHIRKGEPTLGATTTSDDERYRSRGRDRGRGAVARWRTERRCHLLAVAAVAATVAAAVAAAAAATTAATTIITAVAPSLPRPPLRSTAGNGDDDDDDDDDDRLCHAAGKLPLLLLLYMLFSFCLTLSVSIQNGACMNRSDTPRGSNSVFATCSAMVYTCRMVVL